MSKSVIYSGNSDAVETSDSEYVFPNGVAVEVPDELADSLCQQDTFSLAPVTPPAPPVKNDGDK